MPANDVSARISKSTKFSIKYGKQYGDSLKNEKLRDFPGGHWLRLPSIAGVGFDSWSGS